MTHFEILERPGRLLSIARLGWCWYDSYFGAQKAARFEDAIITERDVDRRIRADEQAIYPYLFAVFYLGYASWLMLAKLPREDYERASKAFGGMITEAEKVFRLIPSRMKSRAEIRHPLTKLLQGIDGPTNCFPSLHVALAVLSYQVIRGVPEIGSDVISAMRSACVDLCRSTMKIRQHSVIDVIGGYALARQTFETKVAGQFEDCLAEILPELRGEERTKVDEVLNDQPNLPELLSELMRVFPDPEKSLIQLPGEKLILA